LGSLFAYFFEAGMLAFAFATLTFLGTTGLLVPVFLVAMDFFSTTFFLAINLVFFTIADLSAFRGFEITFGAALVGDFETDLVLAGNFETAFFTF